MMPRLVSILFLAATAPLAAVALEWRQTLIEQVADPLDEEARVTYHFTNTGNAPATISDVKTSCGCTVPELTKRTYAPGESGELGAIFKFNALVGRQTKTITVTTDEPEVSTYQLTLQVDIPKLFDLDRHFVVWRRGEEATPKSLVLRVLMPELVKVVGVEAQDARFSAKAEPGEDPGVYQIVITPEATDLPRQASLIVKTDFPSHNPKVLTIYALVR
ncbi:MAG TPA: DUF1573 domain-containing protein [Opitutaceae bacterium]